MNRYRYDEINVGLSACFDAVITGEMMDAFLAVTGDRNPMHLDNEYAQAHGFGGKLVYGMLTAGFYSTLAGVYLPGENCLLQEINVTFNAPVYVGDALEVSGHVVEKLDVYKRITIKATIKRGDKTVSRAVIKAGVSE